MKVLASSLASAGHVAAVKPVVTAATDAGCEVRVVVDEAAAEKYSTVASSVVALEPMDAELAEYSDRAWGRAVQLTMGGDIDGSNRVAMRDCFGAANAGRALPAIRAQLDEFEPDLVLADPFEPGALIAAAETGVPLVLASWLVSAPLPGFLAVLMEGAAEATRADGTAALATAARASSLSPIPPSLDRSAPEPWRDPIRWHPSPTMPRRAKGAADKPFVYATMGTIVGKIPPLANRFLACLGPAVDAIGAECLLTVGPDAVTGAFEVPDGLRVETFAAHATVMPRADAVVSHGGINTVLDAAACGVPQVVLPMQALDQHETALRITDHGAGIGVPFTDQSPAAVTAALQAVLTSSEHGSRAEALADEMSDLATTAAAWDVIVASLR